MSEVTVPAGRQGSQRSETRDQRSEVRSQKSDNPYKSVLCLLSSVLCLLFSVFFSALVQAQTVAVLEFRDESSPASVIAPTTIRKLFTDLFPPEEFTLIDRDLIQKIVPTTTQEAVGEITPSMANMLGQILGADILVIGKYREMSGGMTRRGSLLVNASFIDTARSRLGEGINRQIMNLFEATFTREGLVEAVSDKIIILNIGSFHGVQIGDQFRVMRADYQVGEVKVSRVERYMSEAVLVSSTGGVQVGDMIRRSPLGPLVAVPKRALIVDSTPSGTSVSLNGGPRGITPLIISGPDPKPFVISLVREGYHPFQEEVLVEENRSSFLDINIVLARLQEKGYLPSAKASKIIVSSSPSNAKVYLNGELKGITPITLTDLPAGLFMLRVAKTGFRSVEREVVLKEQEEKRVNLNLEPSPQLEAKGMPARPIPPPPEIFQVQTPYTQNKGGFYIALKYPEIFAARFGLLDGLELRLQGLGLGAKYQFNTGQNRLALDLYYSLHDFRRHEDKTSLDLRGIFGMPFDSGFGMINLTAGAGYRTVSDEGFRYFGGFDNYLTSRLKLLAEYDSLDGWAAGIRCDLPKDSRFAIGAGNERDGTFRLDASLSIQR